MAGIRSDNQGKSFPLGAAVCPDGVNFSIFSKHSTAMALLLFDRVDESKPSRVVALDPLTNRTYHYWHAFVPRVKTGQLYAYRVRGPYAPERGLRFDSDKVLPDVVYNHHVMIRGIERRKIFKDDKDRENLIERLSILLPETKTQCYAWAFLSNHAHFLLRSGPSGIAALMRRLLTGYAQPFKGSKFIFFY